MYILYQLSHCNSFTVQLQMLKTTENIEIVNVLLTDKGTAVVSDKL